MSIHIANCSQALLCWQNYLCVSPQLQQFIFQSLKNGHHIAGDISNESLRMQYVILWLKCHWSLFPGLQFGINQHWFSQWLGANSQQTITWTSLQTHICVTSPTEFTHLQKYHIHTTVSKMLTQYRTREQDEIWMKTYRWKRNIWMDL